MSPPVSTCITTCKRAAPPPVPPRTTSKPYISVTVQSSTESAQDNYLDQHDQRSEVNSQSSHAHSNSSDSLDSTRANSLARGIPRPPHIIPTPIATPREPLVPAKANASTETSDAYVQHESHKSGLNKVNLPEEPLVVPVPRRKLSSIGIQVGQVCLMRSCRLHPRYRKDTSPYGMCGYVTSSISSALMFVLRLTVYRRFHERRPHLWPSFSQSEYRWRTGGSKSSSVLLTT